MRIDVPEAEAWLQQFTAADLPAAKSLVRNIQYVSADELRERMTALLEGIPDDQDRAIALYAERRVPGPKTSPHPLYKWPRRKVRRAEGIALRPADPDRPFEPDIGSEGIIAQLISDLQAKKPNLYRVHPSMQDLRARRPRKFVLVTDFTSDPVTASGDSLILPGRYQRLSVGLLIGFCPSFFESITERQVYGVFHNLGYQPLVAFELARLCTRVRDRPPPSGRWIARADRTRTITAYWHGQFGYVPQGAPTSPRLSNLVVKTLDEKVRAIAARADLIYTRYADDLTFSTTSNEFSRKTAAKVIGEVYRALAAHGFSPNLSKTKIVSPRGRKVVLGLLVDGAPPRLQREFKARLRQHLHYLTHPEFGPERHAAANGHATIYGLKNHIQGLLAFAHGVEPDYARTQTALFRSIAWP